MSQSEGRRKGGQLIQSGTNRIWTSIQKESTASSVYTHTRQDPAGIHPGHFLISNNQKLRLGGFGGTTNIGNAIPVVSDGQQRTRSGRVLGNPLVSKTVGNELSYYS